MFWALVNEVQVLPNGKYAVVNRLCHVDGTCDKVRRTEVGSPLEVMQDIDHIFNLAMPLLVLAPEGLDEPGFVLTPEHYREPDTEGRPAALRMLREFSLEQ